jgi:hypothetical protein
MQRQVTTSAAMIPIPTLGTLMTGLTGKLSIFDTRLWGFILFCLRLKHHQQNHPNITLNCDFSS